MAQRLSGGRAERLGLDEDARRCPADLTHEGLDSDATGKKPEVGRLLGEGWVHHR